MPRLASVVVLCALLAGCGGGGGGSTSEASRSAPEAAAPVHRGGQEQRSAQQVAAYRTAVNDALASYAAAQRRAFKSLRGADAPAFVAALRRLRRATAGAADELTGARPPAAVAVPHRQLVTALRSLAAILGAAIEARDRGDFARLRRIGRRLQSGEFSRPIESAAREIDAQLG